MAKVLAYIILIAGLSTVAFTQSTFQLIIEKNDSTSPSSPTASITETSNGEIYAMSTIYPFGGYSKIRLIKMNKFGEVLWDTTYKQTSGYEFFPEVTQAHDGGVIVASLSNSYVIDDKDSTWDMLIWNISEEGSIEWQQALSSFSFTDMYPTEDKGSLFFGST